MNEWRTLNRNVPANCVHRLILQKEDKIVKLPEKVVDATELKRGSHLGFLYRGRRERFT